MPVDTTRVINTRRSQKQITEEELKQIELKRLRGEVSCAECRRLKLKCDKKVPCSSCIRRGCDTICPCGILSAGQGTRFILADTDQLHCKIAEMSTRIRQLEDALAILQASISEERHPLLTEELLKMKFGGEALDHKPPEPSLERNAEDVVDALGTLALGDDGNAAYFGRSAGSETLMLAEGGEGGDFSEANDSISLPPEIEHLSNRLPPFTDRRPTRRSLELLGTFLPDRVRAIALCHVWIDHGSYFFRPFSPSDLLDVLLPYVYDTAASRAHIGENEEDHPDPLDTDDPAFPHKLATLFMVFSIGSLLDINLPPYNAQGEHFYHLGRGALSLRNTYSSNYETVQAIGLMATYHSLAGKKYTRHGAWCIMNVAAKLAQSSGLHRDSARWNLDPEWTQRRRNLFWEVFSADVSHSLALGRPPVIPLSYVDCEYPEDMEATLSDTGEIQCGFWRLKHDYSRNMLYSVAETTLTAKLPSYATVLDLDRKIREMPLPASMKPHFSPADGEEGYYSTSLSIRDFYATQFASANMLYLHRSFFAQAMLDYPTNPLQSPFAPSFLTAYRCASTIIKASSHWFTRCETLVTRIWFLLCHTFSAAIIVGTIVTRCPNVSMAANALNDLEVAVLLFERAAPHSLRARVALVVLKRLQDKASETYRTSSSGHPTGTAQVDKVSEAAQDLSLAIFGGQARVLTTKTRPQPNLPPHAGSATRHDPPQAFDTPSQSIDLSFDNPYYTAAPIRPPAAPSRQTTSWDRAWTTTCNPAFNPPPCNPLPQQLPLGYWGTLPQQGVSDMNHALPSTCGYQGSDGMGPSQIDAGPAFGNNQQENIALLSSFGLVPNSMDVSLGGGPQLNQGGDLSQGKPVSNPGVSDFLPGEPRDSNWLALMQDVGILGTNVSMGSI
ncbi:fungal-specific transcription factor domain-containing protein [Ephemerocybe angulata]|uniref:Fungal-specific transcription factor domain-containing protein n=1 Tax=Ephemerocybe angulata TaxID=980116 RepID=A0A8H6M087_9AGAR|nr:fungal-specific transcription factor domain-containing protein [Tulosesus angulatus]